MGYPNSYSTWISTIDANEVDQSAFWAVIASGGTTVYVHFVTADGYTILFRQNSGQVLGNRMYMNITLFSRSDKVPPNNYLMGGTIEGIGSNGPVGPQGVTGPSFTVSNFGVNRVLVSNGTANGATAQSNLTFNGSTFSIVGGLNISGVTNSILLTDSSGNVGPSIITQLGLTGIGIGQSVIDARLSIKALTSGTSSYALTVRDSSNNLSFFSVRDDGRVDFPTNATTYFNNTISLGATISITGLTGSNRLLYVNSNGIVGATSFSSNGTGATGPAGATGPQGPTGPAGSNGTNGSRVDYYSFSSVAFYQTIPNGNFPLNLGINNMVTSNYSLHYNYLGNNTLYNAGSNTIIVRVKFNYNFGGVSSTPGTTRAVYANGNGSTFDQTCNIPGVVVWGINADTIAQNPFTGNSAIVNNLAFTANLSPGDAIYFFTYNDDTEDVINNSGGGIGSMLGFMQVEIIY